MDEGDELREKIRRYCNLHTLNPDAQARRVLEELIKETQAKLDGIKQAEAEC